METSIVDVVIGMQYGDEGKGKIANQMAASGEYDYVVRFNGGGNAGHTIYLNGEKIVTHLVPCGILHGIHSVIGNGCVINTQKLFDELAYLEGLGFDTTLLKIAENAHIITQDHIDEDSKDTTIGTTRTGNGPCYKDKVGRTGLRAKDVSELKSYLVDMYSLIHSSPKKFLAEGAQGYWLDIDFGDYPYVTSSNTGVGAVLNNGFNYQQIWNVVGVIKCYSTYVGAKEYQQMHDDRFEQLREIGQEYGATTGRPRQINWLNLDEVITACQMNGVTKLIINKMDVLRQVDCAWNYYKDNLLTSCANEDTFVNNIRKEIGNVLPGTLVQFQGQLH
jgi:adenylosuccinate synthase